MIVQSCSQKRLTEAFKSDFMAYINVANPAGCSVELFTKMLNNLAECERRHGFGNHTVSIVNKCKQQRKMKYSIQRETGYRSCKMYSNGDLDSGDNGSFCSHNQLDTSKHH